MQQGMKFKTCPERSRRIPPTGRWCGGFSLVELSVTTAISLILLLTVGVVLFGSQRAWQRAYETANKKIKQDAEAVMLAFGSVGRKSNQVNYVIYNVIGSTFTRALPTGTSTEEVVFGDAVEFRYWDVELDLEDTHELMDTEKTATAYALFYFEDDELKVDYGPYDSDTNTGAIPPGGGTKNNPTMTKILAENVTTDDDRGAFSHTTINGVGQGSVRINITITDPEDDESIKVMTATLIRNEWPRW